jgi:periplasmic protein TonB
MTSTQKLLALALAIALHVPLFLHVREGLQRGEPIPSSTTQPGVAIKLAPRLPAPATPEATPAPPPVPQERQRPASVPAPPTADAATPPSPAEDLQAQESSAAEPDEDPVDDLQLAGQTMGLSGASLDGALDDDMERYIGLLYSRVQRLKEYPQQARLRGEEGVVEATFGIGPKGEILNFRITSSSGSAMLDRAVERLFSRLRLPSPEESLLPELASISIPVVFELR